MTTYTLYSNGVLEKDGFYVPFDELNPAYQEYLTWVALGNTPTSADGSIYLAKLAQAKLDLNQIKNEYAATIQTLTDIENAVSPTNAQVIAAVKFLAKTVRLMLKLLARQYQ